MNIWKLLGDCAVVSVSMFVGMIIYNMIWDQSEALSKVVRINTRLGMDRHLKLERVQLLLDRHSQLWC